MKPLASLIELAKPPKGEADDSVAGNGQGEEAEGLSLI
jgi:hypothetical protein